MSVCVATEWPLRSGWESDFVARTLMREGISTNETTYVTLLDERPYAGDMRKAPAGVLESGRARLLESISSLRPNVILALGGSVSELLTGKSGLDKWHCSVLPSTDNLRKVIPCFPADRVAKDLSLQLWVSICARKAAAERHSPLLIRSPHVHLLNPPLEETLAYLRGPVRDAPIISVDIETGRGQINTMGFAISPHEAIAINVLPDRLGTAAFRELWSAIAEVLQGPQTKVLQNFIYEYMYLSKYGIRLGGTLHDTMIRQKFLWPEFEMGLDYVGRMYSGMPYWKDDGKSWNDIRDWERHYSYNCKDTCGTFEGYLGQQRDLEQRGLHTLYDTYLRRLFAPVGEMCSWGIPVCERRLTDLRAEVGGEYEATVAALRLLPGADLLNPRSPAQVKAFLTSPPRKYLIPKRYDSKEKKYKESTDEKSLKKLRLKYPEDPALPALLRIAKLGKAHSSYLSFGYDADKRMRYSINCHGTETGRFSANCDPWGNGVNPQTVPGGGKGINIKSIFEAEPGFVFLQCDLKQAESRFVAYDAADAALIACLEDPTRDIHKEVASEIFGVPVSEVTKQQRQLGKKSGHGANYSMKEATFQDSCLSEMDLVLGKSEATKVLEAYHKLFPGIRNWHRALRTELVQNRCLRTPLGRVRQCWGRLDDDTFRQFYAYRPQSTVPDIVNHLMLHLLDLRAQGKFDFRLLLQCHDSVLLELPEKSVEPVASACLSVSEWHPRIDLAGGRLVIPTEVEVGKNYGELKVWRKDG